MLDNSRRDECPAELFSRNQTSACEEFVFRSDEVGVSNAVSILVSFIQHYFGVFDRLIVFVVCFFFCSLA